MSGSSLVSEAANELTESYPHEPENEPRRTLVSRRIPRQPNRSSRIDRRRHTIICEEIHGETEVCQAKRNKSRWSRERTKESALRLRASWALRGAWSCSEHATNRSARKLPRNLSPKLSTYASS